jgi:hypothetical protein
MSRKEKDRLYRLLPSVYRQQDITQQTKKGNRPLQDLMSIMEAVLETLEKDIEGLYENWFIETCDEWVAPYIGDLVGASLLRSVKGNSAVSARAYVANTLHYRKRKGTAAVMEEIARDVTGWDAHAVEFFLQLSTTQNINHARLENYHTPGIVDPELVEVIDTAFDPAAHTLDVRHVTNGLGYYNIPNLGIFLWRLTAYPVKEASAAKKGEGRYTFNQLGEDMPLFNHPVKQASNGLSIEINVSTLIRRLAMKKYIQDYYGEDKSVLVELNGEKKTADQIIVCDLGDDGKGGWQVPDEFNPPKEPKDLYEEAMEDLRGKIAIDPTLGRLMLPYPKVGDKVIVTYYYGFSADIGGGLYRRNLYEPVADAMTYLIGSKGNYPTLSNALKAWSAKKTNAVFEFTDNNIYMETELNIQIPASMTVVLRSAAGKRATLRTEINPTLKINVTGEENSCLVLDGLLLDRSLKIKVNNVFAATQKGNIKSDIGAFVAQHCTFVPPISKEQEQESIEINGNDFITVTLDDCITGPVYMQGSKGKLMAKDSIIDCGFLDEDNSESLAVNCVEASLENVTVFGQSVFETLFYASNVIFTDKVEVKRRQEGCVRFSYIAHLKDADVTVASRMPRCYRCQPEAQDSKVIPRFTSRQYGHPGYAQLDRRAFKEIAEGADNDSEMGAFNQIYQAHRLNNLRATFSEYLPLGLEAGIILVT